MGRLITTTIANLISGVSQQPWNVRLPTQAEEQINCYSSVTDFLKRRPATRHLAELPAPEGDAAAGVAAHVINRDEDEKYIALFSTGGIIVRDLDGNPKSVAIQDGAAAYLAQAANAERDLRFLTINDYTFVLNRRVTVRKKEDSLSPKRQPEALVFIKQASYNTTYNVTVDGKTASFTTLDGVAPADQPADKLSSSEIAQSLGDQITAFGGYTVGYSNATLWIRKADGTDFKVKVEDTRSNTHMVVCKGQSQRFSDLPTVAPRDYVVEVIGDQSSSFDNYYCVFEPTDEGNRGPRHSLRAGPGQHAARPDPAGGRHVQLRAPGVGQARMRRRGFRALPLLSGPDAGRHLLLSKPPGLPGRRKRGHERGGGVL